MGQLEPRAWVKPKFTELNYHEGKKSTSSNFFKKGLKFIRVDAVMAEFLQVRASFTFRNLWDKHFYSQFDRELEHYCSKCHQQSSLCVTADRSNLGIRQDVHSTTLQVIELLPQANRGTNFVASWMAFLIKCTRFLSITGTSFWPIPKANAKNMKQVDIMGRSSESIL